MASVDFLRNNPHIPGLFLGKTAAGYATAFPMRATCVACNPKLTLSMPPIVRQALDDKGALRAMPSANAAGRATSASGPTLPVQV
jgi:hypothetical protein